MVVTVGIYCSETDPDPYHGVALVVDPPPIPHYPGTHTPPLYWPAGLPPTYCTCLRGPGRVHQASFGYSGVENIPFVAKPPLLVTRKTPLLDILLKPV